MKNMKKITWRISLVLTIITITYLGLRAREINNVIQQLDEKFIRAQEQLEAEEEKLEALQEERKSMDSLEYIEKVAREKLGMVKEDDIVFKEKKH